MEYSLEKYETYDMWLLMSLHGYKKGCGWEDIIHTGDRLNHSIFTWQELNYGMSKLVFNNWVEITKKGTFKETEQAKTFIRKHKKFNEDYISEWLRMSDILIKIPAAPDCPYVEYISEEEYNKIVQKYGAWMQKLLNKLYGKR
ncbi:MAG: hypothetical protein LBS74_00995 [Oscillospiraceae bacterium]|jgi:hypothetical protein|nr:hypothetical protein [Oscillospiraceae bacterium]